MCRTEGLITGNTHTLSEFFSIVEFFLHRKVTCRRFWKYFVMSDSGSKCWCVTLSNQFSVTRLCVHGKCMIRVFFIPVSYFTELSMYAQMGGIVLCPLGGIIYDWNRTHFAGNDSSARLTHIGASSALLFNLIQPFFKPLCTHTMLWISVTGFESIQASVVSCMVFDWLVYVSATSIFVFLWDGFA